jgi:hypothetical protein
VIREDIFTKLQASGGLANLVGARIWPVNAPQSWDPDIGPAVTFTVDHDQAGACLDGADGTAEAEIELAALAVIEADALAVAKVLRSEWSGFSGTVGNTYFHYVISRGRLLDYVDAIEGSDLGYYAVTLTYQVGHSI